MAALGVRWLRPEVRAALNGTRRDAIRALLANPLCTSLPQTEAMYDEMAHAHGAFLPERLLPETSPTA